MGQLPESHGGAVFALHVPLDVQLVDGVPATEAADPALRRRRRARVGVYERVQGVQVAEKLFS